MYLANRLAVFLACFSLFFLISKGQTTEIGKTINVPFDYANPAMGNASLYVELGAPFDKTKPTVLVVADGQQFYVRRGSVAKLQQNTFGPDLNVVGIVTRGSTKEFIAKTLDQSGNPDWEQAWRIFKSEQWIQDIESVRRSIVGDRGKVLLYGRSGGAYLVHQYLAKYGQHVARAFTQSAVNPQLNKQLNIPMDTFWEELARQDPNLQAGLRQVLDRFPQERLAILLALQRQHFYLTVDQIAKARSELIQSLAKGETVKYEQARKDYEVDDVLKLSRSPEIIPQNVRVLELLQPSGAFDRIGGPAIYPLLETQREFIKPLLELLDRGKIGLTPFDPQAAHSLTTEVFVLAGRFDEAVDYRTSIALSYLYPHHVLFIADDNHVFAKLTESGASSRLIHTFLRFGIASPQFETALEHSNEFRWQGLN